MRFLRIFSSVLLLSILLINCSNEDTFTIEEIDGVRHVHNISPQWGENPEVELEFVSSIGDDSENDNYMFFRAALAMFDKDGNIYILDSGNHRIQKFDPQGQYVATIGSEGQGPGEFLNPSGMVIDDENNLHVLNLQNMRVDKFDLDGDYISSYKLKIMIVGFSLLGDGKIVSTAINMDLPGIPGGDMKKTLMIVMDNNGEIIDSFGEITPYDDPMLEGMANAVAIGVDSDKNIFAAYAFENRIEKFSSTGELLFRFDRPLPFEVVNEMGERTFNAQGREMTIPFPSVTQVSSGTFVDNKNRIWVGTFHEKPELPEDLSQMQDATFPEAMHIEIYDSEGTWLGKIGLPEGLVMSGIQDENVFFADKDLTSIHVYRIVEK